MSLTKALRLKNNKKQEIAAKSVVFILLCFFGVLFSIPFYWMISTSLKTRLDVYILPPQFIPNPIKISNYWEILDYIPLGRYFLNSIFVTSLSIFGYLLSSSLVAYGFARINAPGRNMLFLLVLATMMIPFEIIIVPWFVIFRSFGWINTYLPLIVPTFTGHPFFIFLLRQFFLTIPKELEDAMTIDGCGYLKTWMKLILPLSKVPLLTVGIFSFMWTWNSFLWPLIVINSKELWTVAIGVAFFATTTVSSGEIPLPHLQQAAAFLSLVPCFVIFFIAQRLFVQGITLTGLKE